MKRNKIIVVFVEICISLCLFQGCWDMREINELGLVMAVGIDKKDDDEFNMTVQIAKPNESGGTTQGAGSEPVWIGTASGKTLFEAIRNIATMSSRRIMWAHNNIIIIGESVARDDITPVVDFFSHNSELRMKTWVAVVKGDARPFVEAKTGMESVPSLSISRLYQYNELQAKSIKSDMLAMFRDYKSDTKQPLISQLNMEINASGKKPQIQLAGSGVFKHSKLVGFLTPDETRGVNFIREEMNSSILSVSSDLLNNKRVTVELRNINTSMKSRIVEDIPQVDISITAIGDITEQDGVTNISLNTFKNEVENLVEMRIKGEVEDVIKKLQIEYDSDAIGFGRIVHIQNKTVWNNEFKYKWNDIFKKVAVKVNADVDIRSSTLFENPMNEEKEKGGS